MKRIVYIADGRSPITLSWVNHFIQRGDEVHLISTYHAEPDLKLAWLKIVPVAFSQAAGTKPQGSQSQRALTLKRFLPTNLRTKVRQWLGPLTLPQAAKQVRAMIDEINPDFVHALRIPYEGMLAGLAHPKQPLVISVWGNDFTLHAKTSPLMRRYTRIAVRRADALLTDTRRDIRLAKEWGFDDSKPHDVLITGGGIKTDIFYPPKQPVDAPVIINPRGLRAYVRNDTFFKAIPLVLKEVPEARFLCTTMQGEAQAESWVQEYGIEENVELLGFQSPGGMADLFRQASIMVSPSEHDGTPNSLLESMACGCFPVLGDIESIREWVTDGKNGLLINPGDPQALAKAIIKAVQDKELRRNATIANLKLVHEKVTFQSVMKMAENFYEKL